MLVYQSQEHTVTDFFFQFHDCSMFSISRLLATLLTDNRATEEIGFVYRDPGTIFKTKNTR